MQIDWWTLALQGINFLVLVWLLKRFLYHPVRDIVAARKDLSDKALTNAEAREAEATKALKGYQDDRAALEREREQMRVDAHHALETEREKIRAEAAKVSADMLAKAREGLAEERTAAISEMRASAIELATEMAGKILAGGDDALMQALAFGHIEKSLKDLAHDARDKIDAQLKKGSPLDVATATALKPTEEKRWQKMLETCLKIEAPVTFSVDPTLLGGAELRLPHITLGYTLAGELKGMREELLGDDHAQD